MGLSQSTENGNEKSLDEKIRSIKNGIIDTTTLGLNAYALAKQNYPEYKRRIMDGKRRLFGGDNDNDNDNEDNLFYGGDNDENSYFGGGSGKSIRKEAIKDLKIYAESNAAKTKENIIRGMARALKNAKIPVDPDADMSDIVQQIKSAIPNPRKGKTFEGDAKVHEYICKNIAKVLNDEFTPITSKKNKLINMSDGAVSICRQVAEYIHSLSLGLNEEFLEVHVGIRRALKNVNALDIMMSELYDKISATLQDRADDITSSKVAPYDEAFRRIQVERDRQVKMLENFMHITLGPAEEELAIALAEEGEVYNVLKNINLVPGSGEFGTALAAALSGIGTAAGIAMKIHVALKMVGITINDYVNNTSWGEVDDLINKVRFNGKISAEDMGTFERGVNLLKQNFWRKDELAPAVKDITKSITGSAEDKHLTPLDKRVEKRSLERKLILKQFLETTARSYAVMIKSIADIGSKLGVTIPLSEQLFDFKEALTRMSKMRGMKFDLSLIGFYTASGSREQRDTYLAELRQIHSTIDTIINLPKYKNSIQYFTAIKDSIETILKTIDHYTDLIIKKYGGDGDAGAGADADVVGGDEDDDLKTGGAILTTEEMGLVEISKSKYDLTEAVNNFAYFYYISKVRDNLTRTKGELAVYSEDYDDVLGDAVAGALNRIEKIKKDKLDESATSALGIGPRPAKPPPGAPVAVVEDEEDWVATKDAIEHEYKIKVKFYRALEALDIYMKTFTDGIVSNPSDAIEIKQMLEGVNLIGRWFTEESGDELAKVFEMFPPSEQNINGIGYNIVAPHTKHRSELFTSNMAPGEHMYEKVHALAMQKQTLHIEYTPGSLAPTRSHYIKDIRSQIGKSLANVQVLKNLVSAFTRIGDKFGGKEVRKGSFMSPSQIYRTLTEYIQCSALSVGIGHHTVQGAPALTRGYSMGHLVPMIIAGREKYITYLSTIKRRNLLTSQWETEDLFFTFMIKAMSAKILTVVGVYQLFERPEPVYSITPTRVMIGGGNVVPDIISDAAELYFRLPRLAEFYFNLFNLGGDDIGVERYSITMIPEMEGIFSGFIKEMFYRAVGQNSGKYTDMEVQAIIREINDIFGHYKGKVGVESACTEALNKFVIEINRRYGIIKRTEMEKFLKILYEDRNLSQLDQVDDTNINIIDDGEFDTDSSRPSPSDKFVRLSSEKKIKWRPGLYDLDVASNGSFDDDSKWSIVRNFRDKLDNMFSNPDIRNHFGKISYTAIIKQAKIEINSSKLNAEKLITVNKLIQGSKLTSTGDIKMQYMFHETVVVGLNTLNGIYTLLDNLRLSILSTDMKSIQSCIKKWVCQIGPIGAGGVQPIMPPIAWWSSGQLGRIMNDEIPNVWGNNINNYPIYLGSTAAVSVTLLGAEFCKPQVINNTPGNDIQTMTLQTLYSYTADLYQQTYNHITNLGVNVVTSESFAEISGIFQRYMINYNKIMRTLLNLLFDVSSNFDGLIKISYPATEHSSISLDFSGIKNVIDSLLTDVKYFMKMFRPHLSEDIIKRYEQKTVNGVENMGSLFWLEDKLIDHLVSEPPLNTKEYVSLNGLSKIVSSTYYELTKQHTYGAIFDAGATATQTNLFVPLLTKNACEAARVDYHQFGAVLSGLTFYDNTKSNSGITVDRAIFTNNAMSALMYDYEIGTNNKFQVKYLLAGANISTNANAIHLRQFAIYEAAQGYTQCRSIMMLFNQIVSKFITIFYEPVGGKIYQNLLSTFSSGVYSRAILNNGYTHPDIAYMNMYYGKRGDPTENSTLLFSLALIIRRLLKDVTKQNISSHLISTLAEIPTFMKETYKSHLPIFIKQFHMLIEKCQLIQNILQYTKIRIRRPQVVNTYDTRGGVPAAGCVIFQPRLIGGAASISTPPDGQERYHITMAGSTAQGDPIQPDITFRTLESNTSDNIRKSIIDITNTIMGGSYSMIETSEEVLREIADDPQFMQLSENWVEIYKNRHDNTSPLTPLSTILTYIRTPMMDNHDIRDIVMSPDQIHGSMSFKLAYCVRKVLNSNFNYKISLNDMPSINSMLNDYNNSVSDKNKLDVQKFQNFTQNVISGIKFITGMRQVRGSMINYDTNFYINKPIVNVENSGIRTFNENNNLNAAYSIIHSINDSISIIESPYISDKMTEIITKTISNSTINMLGNNRELERIINIIDMNIVPINIHALMRGIPLINIFNYAYTFDQMICRMYEKSRSKIQALDTNIAVTLQNAPLTTTEFLLKLILDPYCEIDYTQFGSDVTERGTAGFVHRLFRGDNAVGLGRPKYLSDQIFNKSLFCSIYPSIYDYDEAGPTAAAAYSRAGDRGNVTSYGSAEGDDLVRTMMIFNSLMPPPTRPQGKVAILNEVERLFHVVQDFYDAFESAINITLPGFNLPATRQTVNRVWSTAGNITTGRSLQSFLQHMYRFLGQRQAGIFNIVRTRLVYSTIANTSPDTTPATMLLIQAMPGGVNQANTIYQMERQYYAIAQSLGYTGRLIPTITPPHQALTNDELAQYLYVSVFETRAGIRSPFWGNVHDNVVHVKNYVSEIINISKKYNPVVDSIDLGPGLPFLHSPDETDSTNIQRGQTFPNLDRNNTITYIGHKARDSDPDWKTIKRVSIPNGLKNRLTYTGKDRFDTRIIRNLFFLTNVYRLLRLKINIDLTKSETLLVSGQNIIDSNTTEYGQKMMEQEERASDAKYVSQIRM